MAEVRKFYEEKFGIENHPYFEDVVAVEQDYLTGRYGAINWTEQLAYLKRLRPAELLTHGAWLYFAVAYRREFKAFLPRPRKYLDYAFPSWFPEFSDEVIGDFFLDCKGGDDLEPCTFPRLLHFAIGTWFPNKEQYESMSH